MSAFKMVYEDKVYNVIEVMPIRYEDDKADKKGKFRFINAVYIDDNSELRHIEDEAWKFQFIRSNHERSV